MNQQIQPEKPAIKKQTLLVNLSLVAYVCLLLGFLQYFSPHSIPYGLFTSVIENRKVASDATVYHSSKLPDGIAASTSIIESDSTLGSISLNASDIYTIGSITKNPEDPDNPENPEENGGAALKVFSSIKDPSADSTDVENAIIGHFAVVGGSSQGSDVSISIKYYTSTGDSAVEVPVEHFTSWRLPASSSDGTFVRINGDNKANLTGALELSSNQSFIQVTPSMMSEVHFMSTPYMITGSYTPGSHLLRGVNTLMALLGGLLPCFLLLLYVWKFHDHPRGKYFVPVACGMIALSHVYSIINIIVPFLRGFGSFTYLLNLVVPAAMAACYIIIPLSSRNGGNVSKKWWVITTIVSAVYGLQPCLSISVLIPDFRFFSTSLPYVLPYALTAVGHVLFLAGLLLYVFFNLLPKKDDGSDKEEPTEPIIESKNMAPPPQPAQ